MATEEGIQQAETEEPQTSVSFTRQSPSCGQDKFGRERRLSTSTWGESAEKPRSCQSTEDPRGIESRLAAIRQTHDAVLKGIDAAQEAVVRSMQEQEKQYLRTFQQRTQDILEQTKKLQKKQKPPLELETLHQMLSINLKAAEEEAKHFAALSKTLTEKNKELVTENSILREQNEILMRQRAIQQRKVQKRVIEKGDLPIPRKGCGRASPETPEVSPRLLGPPLTPRTVAKVKAKIRQYAKANNYERELKMRAEISRLHELCNKQKSELIVLRGTDGRRVELELLLKQCLLDVRARLAGKRNSTMVPKETEGAESRGSITAGGELSMAGRDEVLKRFLKMEQVIKLLHQIVSATGTANEFDFSWLNDEEAEPNADCRASPSPPPAYPKATNSYHYNRSSKRS